MIFPSPTRTLVTQVLDIRVASVFSQSSALTSHITKGAAAVDAERAKIAEYADWVITPKTLIPIVIENGGRMLPSSMEYLKNLLQESHVGKMEEFGKCWSSVLTTISVVLQKANTQRIHVHARDFVGPRPRML